MLLFMCLCRIAYAGRYPKAAYKKAPNLAGVDKKSWCEDMRKRYHVIPDVSWGSLPKSQYSAWKAHGCDSNLSVGERTLKLQIAPDMKLAAANKAKRKQAYKPFKLVKAEVRKHKWLEAGSGEFAANVHSIKGYNGGSQFVEKAGKNHYQLMSYLSGLMEKNAGSKITICDIGSKFGDSIKAWTTGSDNNFVHSYDVADVPGMISDMQAKHAPHSAYKDPAEVTKLFEARVSFHKVDINKSPKDMAVCLSAPIMLLDVEHQPVTIPMEYEFIKHVIEGGYRGIIICDDIDLNRDMRDWWAWVPEKRKWNVKDIGHWSGTGIIDFGGGLEIV